MIRHSEVDVLVVGQGLAGSAMVVRLLQAGLTYAVADGSRISGQQASRVAAGLITPLTGKRLNPGWRMDELLPVARDFYASAGPLLGDVFFHPCEIHRWFVGEDDYRSFVARQDDERVRRWCHGMLPPDDRLHVPWGGFAMTGGGWLDVPAWLDAIQAMARADDRWIDASVDEAEIETADGHLHWRGLRAGHVVFCQGLAATGSKRFFPGLPFRPAAGEVLEITLDASVPRAVWNSGGKWIAPRPDGTCLCGATYGFGQAVGQPSPGGRAELDGFLREFLRVGHTVTGHRAGARPIIQQSRPVAGFSAVHPRVAMLNGLGSKGVLTAPWAAGQLVAAIRDGAALDPELDLARLRRQPGTQSP